MRDALSFAHPFICGEALQRQMSGSTFIIVDGSTMIWAPKPATTVARSWRFETEFLATDENFIALVELSGQWIDRLHDRRTPKMIVLDPGTCPGTPVTSRIFWCGIANRQQLRDFVDEQKILM